MTYGLGAVFSLIDCWEALQFLANVSTTDSDDSDDGCEGSSLSLVYFLSPTLVVFFGLNIYKCHGGSSRQFPFFFSFGRSMSRVDRFHGRPRRRHGVFLLSLSVIPFTYGWGLGRLPAAESAYELGEAVLGRTNAAMVISVRRGSTARDGWW